MAKKQIGRQQNYGMNGKPMMDGGMGMPQGKHMMPNMPPKNMGQGMPPKGMPPKGMPNPAMAKKGKKKTAKK